MPVAVVDLELSNIGSVVNMLRHVGQEPMVVARPHELDRATHIILPGVGHYDAGARKLSTSGLGEAITDRTRAGARVLGICLGMQLLCDGSDEGTEPGLGLIAGRFSLLPSETAEGRVRVPHMGWNDVEFNLPNDLVALDGGWRFYFVHSYALLDAGAPSAVGVTVHGIPFVSAIASGNVAGVQFHPEKSHRFGMQLLERFAMTPC